MVLHSISNKEAVLIQRRVLCAILAIYAVVLTAPHGVRAQQSYAVITQNGVPMKTRDGVTLYSDIYRPKADGKFPVILMRTPYDKSVGWAAAPAYQIATHGYVVVVQDVPGIRFVMSPTTATTPSNGLLRCHPRTAKSA